MIPATRRRSFECTLARQRPVLVPELVLVLVFRI
jgi:hypothetical protein